MLQEFTSYFERIGHYPWLVVAAELFAIAAVYAIIVRFLSGTRGVRVFYGAAAVLVGGYLVFNVLASALGLERLSFLFERFAAVLLIILVLVFQPELRRAFTMLGRSLPRWLRQNNQRVIDELVNAATACSARRRGMIVAIQRSIPLATQDNNGVRLDAELSEPLLMSIFFPNNPLHDMGVIIIDGRIAAARVQFEQAEPGEVSGELGSRHRAAVGLTKDSDALVIVVSEETGIISVAEGGRLRRPISPDKLREILTVALSNAPRQAPRPARSDRKALPARPEQEPAT